MTNTHDINRVWKGQYRSDIKEFGMPECKICGGKLRMNDKVDSLYPHQEKFNHHPSCLEKKPDFLEQLILNDQQKAEEYLRVCQRC